MNLENEISRVEAYGVSGFHIDIMDGKFVSEFTYGWHMVEAVKKITKIPIEVHLMVESPEEHLENYLSLSPDSVIIHPESTKYLRKNLLKIKESNVKPAIALKLETPLSSIEYALDLVDSITIISCDEGYGGNKYRKVASDKIENLTHYKQHYNFKINVDGGVNYDIAKHLKQINVDSVVSGSYILNGGDEAVNKLLSI